jgi:hypothetical protein
MPRPGEPRIAELIRPGDDQRSRPPTPTATPYAAGILADVPRDTVLAELTHRLNAPARECWRIMPASIRFQYVAEVYRRAERAANDETSAAAAVDFALTDVSGILNKYAETLA